MSLPSLYEHKPQQAVILNSQCESANIHFILRLLHACSSATDFAELGPRCCLTSRKRGNPLSSPEVLSILLVLGVSSALHAVFLVEVEAMTWGKLRDNKNRFNQ